MVVRTALFLTLLPQVLASYEPCLAPLPPPTARSPPQGQAARSVLRVAQPSETGAQAEQRLKTAAPAAPTSQSAPTTSVPLLGSVAQPNPVSGAALAHAAQASPSFLPGTGGWPVCLDHEL